MTLFSATDNRAMLAALGETISVYNGASWVSLYAVFTAPGGSEIIDGQVVVIDTPAVTLVTADVEDFIEGGSAGTRIKRAGTVYRVTEHYPDGDGMTRADLTEIEDD